MWETRCAAGKKHLFNQAKKGFGHLERGLYFRAPSNYEKYVHRIPYLILRIQYTVDIYRYHVPGTRHQIPGTGSIYQVLVFFTKYCCVWCCCVGSVQAAAV